MTGEPPAVGICIGHSRSGDNGAHSVTGVDEWTLNREIGRMLEVRLMAVHGITSILVEHYHGSNYYQAMGWLAGHLRQQDVSLAIELHFNSAAAHARGYEYLYWPTSSRGRRLAKSLHAAHRREFPCQTSRGIKPRGAHERGGPFLQKTHCPAVVCEPFFGSNSEEWEYYSTRKERLVMAYAMGIAAYMEAL